MKITNLKATALKNKERSLSAGPGVCIVEVETDNGLVGIGEACAQSENDEAALATALILERGIKPIVVGLDPVNPRTIWEKLYLETEWFGRMGTVMHAISALDIALWDLMGKELGVSISRLLGGRFRDDVKTYASIIFDMENFDSMADEAKIWIREGYKAVKFGWGQTRETAFGLDAKRDEAAVKYLRESLGPNVDIMVDVGRYVNWTPAHALEMAKRFSNYGIFWLEEALPQDDVEGFIWLTERSPVKIATGEGEYNRFGFKRLITTHATDIIQPDVGRAGGLTEGMRIADLVQTWNLSLVPHGFSSAINVAANLQWVASMPRATLLEFRRTKSPLMADLVKNPFTAENGNLKIPDRPGLGIELRPDVVEACRVRVN
ncbi:MAG: mandelate racemase/muconate lactonizing enzyme family protein [Thaumarchaeota archaeon]|nr:mandelate racemase/muconate lactonizing enzyme family protein [Nitrososphaerota archaeon]